MTILTPFDSVKFTDIDAPPPPVRDLSYYFEKNIGLYDDVEDYLRITFMFLEEDFINYAIPQSFHIKIINLSDGEAPEVNLITTGNLSIPWTQVLGNYQLEIKTTNFFGESAITIFLLPVNDIIVLDTESDAGVTIRDSLDTINRNVEDINTYPKWLMFYRNVTFQDVQDDRIIFLDPNGSSASDGIEHSSVRFELQPLYSEIFSDDALVMDLSWDSFNPEDDFGIQSEYYYMKLDSDGWLFQTQEEIQFIETFKQTIVFEYQNYLSKHGLTINDAVILKFMFRHPIRTRDSIIIYLMEGLRWQL